jgi:NAD dependent epimerase/dehydratase family enzyme
LARHLPLGIGDLVDSLLFSSARVVPEALVDAGFSFTHETVEAALAELLG